MAVYEHRLLGGKLHFGGCRSHLSPSGWLESFLLCFASKVCLWNQHLPVTDSRHHEPPISGFSEQRWAFDRLSFL